MEGVILVALATTVASSCILNGLTVANDFFDPASTTPTTTTSTIDTGTRGNYYMYFAGAAYCPSAADWSCQFCQQTGPNVQLVQFFSGPANNATRAFIARNDNAQELIVAWRGSVTAQNFYVNFVEGSLVYPYNDGIGVHGGNWNYLLSLYDNVTATLKEQLIAHPTYRVVFVGHSLGSVLATYHIFFLKLNMTPLFHPFQFHCTPMEDVELGMWPLQIGSIVKVSPCRDTLRTEMCSLISHNHPRDTFISIQRYGSNLLHYFKLNGLKRLVVGMCMKIQIVPLQKNHATVLLII